jgi:spermidine/putrescine transport system permease protein
VSEVAAPSPLAAGPGTRTGRFRAWLANPWGRPRFLWVVMLLYLVWSIVPIVIAIRIAFNDGRSRSTGQGFGFRWFWGDPDLSVLRDPSLRNAVLQSLELAGLAVAIAVPLGVALAIGLARWRSRGSGAGNFLMLFPLVTPEIVMGVSLFLVFVHLLTFIKLGTVAQVIGHVTFSLSYVVIVVRGRLLSIGRQLEEAAQDLGASRLHALRLVLLPMLGPAIFAAAMIVFAISLDDFVISAFLASDASTETVPIKIYSNTRGAPNPSVNAVATVMLVFTFLAVALAILAHRWMGRHDRRTGPSAIRDFASLDV